MAQPAAVADGTWAGGLDVTLEASAGLHGGAQRGETINGLALGHVAWVPAEPSDQRLHLHAYASVLALAGRGPTERFLGDFLAASNIEAYDSTRLYTWWVEAHRGDWSLRAGALLADEEFTGTETGGNFFNSAFGWPAFISANTVNTGPAFFVAAPGLRLEHRLGDTAALRLGVYDGDTFDSAAGDPHVNRNGWHYRLGGDQGWFVIGEASLTPAGSPTRFKAGAWLHTATFADVRDDATGRPFVSTGAAPRQHGSNYGAYVLAEHTLAGKSGEAGYLTTYVRAGFSPADRNTLSWALDTGIAATGLLPGRPADIAALGLAHAAFSSRFVGNARLAAPSMAAPDFEQVIEASYSAALSPHFTLQPDVQYIRHPGGSTAQADAFACFLRLKASY